MSGPLRIAVTGANGRMGSAIIRLIETRAEKGEKIAVGRRLDRSVPVELKDLREQVDVVIDFTLPEATEKYVAQAVTAGLPMVVGTTGLSPLQVGLLKDAAKKIPLLFAANMSLGINVLQSVVDQVAQRLGPSFDLDIVESHHRYKKDLPSGTAKALGAEIKGRDLRYHALRSGGIIGEHTVRFTSDTEKVELSHTALSRDVFADGAINAAIWLHKKPAGFYSMRSMFEI